MELLCGLATVEKQLCSFKSHCCFSMFGDLQAIVKAAHRRIVQPGPRVPWRLFVSHLSGSARGTVETLEENVQKPAFPVEVDSGCCGPTWGDDLLPELFE